MSETRLVSLSARSITAALFVLLTAAGFTGTTAAQEFTEIKRLGTSNAMCRPGIETAEQLQEYVSEDYGSVQKVLTDAGWSGDPSDFFQKISSGDFTETSYPPGTELQWMGVKKKGVPMASPNIRWVGEDAFEAFEVVVESNCEVHTLVIPKACCNVALLSSQSVPQASPVITTAPSMCVGETATIDVASATPVSMRMTTPGGESMDLQPVQSDDGYRWQGALNETGTYVVSTRGAGQCGESPAVVETIQVKSCEAAAPPPVVAPPAEKKYFPFLAPFIGRQDRVREVCNVDTGVDGILLGALGGVMIPVNDRLNAFAQAGAAADLDESANGSLFADVGLDWTIGRSGFIGGGVGIWEINDSKDRDGTVFIHGGADTPWRFAGSTVQWFVEGRAFMDDMDEISDNNIVLGGFRMMWK